MRKSTASAGRTRRSSWCARTYGGNTIESSRRVNPPRKSGRPPDPSTGVAIIAASSTAAWSAPVSPTSGEPRHRKSQAAERAGEGLLLRRREFDQGRAHRRPLCIPGMVRDRRLERRNHWPLLQRSPHLIERRLSSLGIGVLPALGELRDRRRVDVARGGDAARAAAAQRGEQECLAAGEYVEALRLKPLQQCLRVAPVAGAILDAGHRARISPEQALDQGEAQRDLRYRRDVIEVDAQTPIGHSLDDLGVAPKQAVEIIE